jgi:L-threonylcarbamoyladenylate synthase
MPVALSTPVVVASDAAVERAVACLREGGLVAFPTETVYGLGADATNGAAVARLYQAKGRPAFNPLIAHVADLDAAQTIGRFDQSALRLAQAFWPGPLTLVVPKAAGCKVAELATAGLDTIAIRIPAHPVARAILRGLGRPVVAPSANRSGHVSPTTAAHVHGDLDGRIDLIVDGGPVTVGVESSIVGCFAPPVLLRPGGLTRQAIEAVLGERLASPAAADSSKPLAPGMLASHYAPKSRVRLDATQIEPGEALLAFGAPLPPGAEAAATVLNLSARGNLAEAAANLFGHLRALDGASPRGIAVMPVPHDGLGEAINDRLARAAVPRE